MIYEGTWELVAWLVIQIAVRPAKWLRSYGCASGMQVEFQRHSCEERVFGSFENTLALQCFGWTKIRLEF